MDPDVYRQMPASEKVKYLKSLDKSQMCWEEALKLLETLKSSKMPVEEIVKHLESLESSLRTRKEEKVTLREGLWGTLPQEILWHILNRLPIVTQCRFRCVCPLWRTTLSTPSPDGQMLNQLSCRRTCTILCNVERFENRFFCHGENIWFRLPEPNWCKALCWVLMATDGGLLCYASKTKSPRWLLIFNPITSSYRVLGPRFPVDDILTFKGFTVDQKTNTFKVMLKKLEMFGGTATVVFDSKTQDWKVFQGNEEAFPDLSTPDFEGKPGFFWKTIFYQQTNSPGIYLAFDLESGLWKAMEVKLPFDDAQDPYHIGCTHDQMVVTHCNIFEGDPIRIWKLDTAKESSDLSTTKWEEVSVNVPDRMIPLIWEFHQCVSHGHDYICFIMASNYWIKYSLGTKKFTVMPNGGRCRRSDQLVSLDFDWLTWEPRMDVDVDLGDFKGKESALLALATEESEDDDIF